MTIVRVYESGKAVRGVDGYLPSWQLLGTRLPLQISHGPPLSPKYRQEWFCRSLDYLIKDDLRRDIHRGRGPRTGPLDIFIIGHIERNRQFAESTLPHDVSRYGENCNSNYKIVMSIVDEQWARKLEQSVDAALHRLAFAVREDMTYPDVTRFATFLEDLSRAAITHYVAPSIAIDRQVNDLGLVSVSWQVW